MNSRERFLRAAHREKPDQVPVAPYMGNYGATLAGVLIGKYGTNAEVMAAAQIKAWEILGQDVVVRFDGGVAQGVHRCVPRHGAGRVGLQRAAVP